MYTVAGLAKLDKLRALAVASHRRLPNYPQLPTVAEAGGPPVATPKELRSRIAADSAGYAILVREGRLPRV